MNSSSKESAINKLKKIKNKYTASLCLIGIINGKDYTSSDDTFITDSVGNKYDIKYLKWNDNYPVLETQSYKVSQLIDGNNFNFTLV